MDAGEYVETRSGLWTRGLLIRRNIADGDLAFFTTWRPAATSIDTLVKVEGHGWHRHVALVILAFAMTAAIRLNEGLDRATSKSTADRHWSSVTPVRQSRSS